MTMIPILASIAVIDYHYLNLRSVTSLGEKLLIGKFIVYTLRRSNSTASLIFTCSHLSFLITLPYKYSYSSFLLSSRTFSAFACFSRTSASASGW